MRTRSRQFASRNISRSVALPASVSILVAVTGCLPLPRSVQAPTEIWTVLSPPRQAAPLDSGTMRAPPITPIVDGTTPGPIRGQSTTAISTRERLVDTYGCSVLVNQWISLDSISIRPIAAAPLSFSTALAQAGRCADSSPPSPRDSATSPRRVAVVTSFQGARYHPEVIRALGESPEALTVAAGVITTTLTTEGARGLLLDFQEMTPEDLQTLVGVSRTIADSARAHSLSQIGIIIPAADSSGYPARILGRVAEVLVVRLFPEHGTGTAPGPIASPAWFARRLGARAGETGVNRIVAGLTADGVLWDNRRGARRITYGEAVRLAEGASTPIVRDPASGNLHATSARDGWELWVADHELIETLIAEGRRIGVTRFALFGLDGADTLLWQVLPQLVKR